ncbi:MAG: peptide MFS transporter [Bacteroidales bacterium]
MFKNQPKGLMAAALSNMGERFGFYTMMAILALFLMTKYGLTDKQAGLIYSLFYALIYGLSIFGGVIADKTGKIKNVIITGLLLMTAGYVVMAIPSTTPSASNAFYLTISCIGLFVIAFGNGLFKGNIQAIVGRLYDNPKYDKMRDSGFQIFYMFINVGAIFAPFFAIGVRNWFLKAHGFIYNSNLPDLCHGFINGTLSSTDVTAYEGLVRSANQTGAALTNAQFANQYLDVFSKGFNLAFSVAIIAMLISLAIFVINKNKLPDQMVQVGGTNEDGSMNKAEIKMTVQETKQRLHALYAVFGVVIFFWFSFHQNGLTLTYFAKDYVDLSQIHINLGFTSIVGAEIFSSVNPFFVVFLTPVIMWFFNKLRSKGKEPSTAKKIALGMGIAAAAYLFLSIFSIALPDKSTIGAAGAPMDMRLTPWIMIGMYFILTVAELFISPLGISFVSKVAPPQYRGLMQGLWLGATAVGNFLVQFGTFFYNSLPVWATWAVFVGACAISMIVMFGMLNWLERIIAKSSEAEA